LPVFILFCFLFFLREWIFFIKKIFYTSKFKLNDMSYETNPILNRLKLSKGWKTSSFPTHSLNYSRETTLWFKVYLFLKVYLLLHGLRLLTCEIRISEVHTKILLLSVTKEYTLPKKSKSKWKTKSFLQILRSPLNTTDNNKSRFLLYLDLQKLKKNSFLFFHQ